MVANTFIDIYRVQAKLSTDPILDLNVLHNTYAKAALYVVLNKEVLNEVMNSDIFKDLINL